MGCSQTMKQRGFFYSIILNICELMKMIHGEIRAWESLEIT
jgi:hypothetical protein